MPSTLAAVEPPGRNIVGRTEAQARAFAEAAWQLDFFATDAAWCQLLISRAVYERETDPSIVWFPRVGRGQLCTPSRVYLALDDLIALGLRVADPEGTWFVLSAPDEQRHIDVDLPAPASPVSDELRPFARRVAACVERVGVSRRALLWATLCLSWPATSPAELAAILPILSAGTFSRADGGLTVDRAASSAEVTYLLAWRDVLNARLPSELPTDWNDRGRRRGTGYYSDRETFLNDARAAVPRIARDRRAFTQAKLAKALGFDRSTLVRYLRAFKVDFDRDVRGA